MFFYYFSNYFFRYGFTGGSQFTATEQEMQISLKKVREREMKWLNMFKNWDKFVSSNYIQLKKR